MDTKESTVNFYKRLAEAYDRTKRAMADREAYERTMKDFLAREDNREQVYPVNNNPYLSK